MKIKTAGSDFTTIVMESAHGTLHQFKKNPDGTFSLVKVQRALPSPKQSVDTAKAEATQPVGSAFEVVHE